MSGHSKFANIKHKKEKNDAAKGKIFTKIGKEIAVAVKEGGSSDPSNNSRLRDVIAKAKSNNMPNDTIERNIKRASGDMSAANYEHITYEGYGPNGTAIIVATLTDNKNRTASNVKNAFTKGSGNVGTPGCVSFMFDKKGQIVIDKEEYEGDADELMMQVLDAGAEDFVEEEDSFEVLTDPDDFSAVRLAMEEAGIPMASAEVTMIPQTYVELTDPKDIANIQKTLDMLDDDDDVQDVYRNWDENDICKLRRRSMDNIEKTLQELFDEMLTHVKGFRRKTYNGVFEKGYLKYRPVLVSLEQLLAETEDEEKDALIEKLSQVITAYAYD